jgi:predicted nucleic acid-binding Zn ribbon protein
VNGLSHCIVCGARKKDAKDTMSGQKCNLIVVDEEHSRNGVVNDLQNLLVVSEKGAIVFGDASVFHTKELFQSRKKCWMVGTHFNSRGFYCCRNIPQH